MAAKKAAKKPSARKPALATIEQEVTFAAPPLVVYEALVDARMHADFTGAAATGEAKEGAKFTAWDGYIEGVHERLEPGRLIVQRWRTSEFPPRHPDSRLTLELAESGRNGTRLRLTHADLPRDQAASYEQGWHDHYWKPLAKWLAKR